MFRSVFEKNFVEDSEESCVKLCNSPVEAGLHKNFLVSVNFACIISIYCVFVMTIICSIILARNLYYCYIVHGASRYLPTGALSISFRGLVWNFCELPAHKFQILLLRNIHLTK